MSGSTSKELLYSEYTGATVAEHVLETLEKKPSKIHHAKIDEPFKKKEKSETFERVKKLMNLIATEENATNATKENSTKKTSDASIDTENEGGIEVIMEVNENNPESNIDAWFLLKMPKDQESKYSDDESEKNSPCKKILEFSDSSSTSDDESEQNFPIIAPGFELNNYSSNYSCAERELNSSRASKTIKKTLNCFISDSSSTSDGESERNFPVIVNGFGINDADSSNSSSDECEQNFSYSEIQNSSNFVDADSSNSSDVKTGQCLSINTANVNQNCVNKGRFQLPIHMKDRKRVTGMSENESSEDVNHEFVKHDSSSSNAEKLFTKQKKFNFVLNGSLNHSLEECKQKNSSMKKQKQFVALKTESSKPLSNETTEYVSQPVTKKRKLCVKESEISNICDSENPIEKKSLCLNGIEANI